MPASSTNTAAVVHPDPRLLQQLAQTADLPSPIGVAMRILELANNPDVSMADVAKVLALDPALTARLLRMANSPLYARQRKTENLHQAIKLFGVEGTMTLALSFSVVNKLREKRKSGFDYQAFWRRSLAAATCAQVVAEHLNLRRREDLFLAALLQDIGMLALAQARPEIYQDLGETQSRHEHVRVREAEVLGMDHAAIGAWLLKQWNFPEVVHAFVSYSHEPLAVGREAPEMMRGAAVVCVASDMAELWSAHGAQAFLRRAMARAENLLALDGEAFAAIVAAANAAVTEIAPLFEAEADDAGAVEAIVSQARELALLRQLRVMQRSEILEDRTRQLEEENRRDPLTGAFNRAHLQQVLQREKDSADQLGTPFTVIFVDLDRFKLINDRYGHLGGDEVLKSFAAALEDCVRSGDVLARYGGEEFVLLLPGMALPAARSFCERLLDTLRHLRHRVDAQTEIAVTASLGVAVYGEGVRYANVEEILRAADGALYVAKAQGRDCCVFHHAQP